MLSSLNSLDDSDNNVLAVKLILIYFYSIHDSRDASRSHLCCYTWASYQWWSS